MATDVNHLGQPIGVAVPNWSQRPQPPPAPMQGQFCHVMPLDVEKHALTELHQALRRRRHAHLAADAQEQWLPELLLEQENLAADRRLRNVQLPPARGKRAGLGNGLKNL